MSAFDDHMKLLTAEIGAARVRYARDVERLREEFKGTPTSLILLHRIRVREARYILETAGMEESRLHYLLAQAMNATAAPIIVVKAP